MMCDNRHEYEVVTRERRLLAETTTLAEVMVICERAEAARMKAEKAPGRLQRLDTFIEIRLWAERRAGELLRSMRLAPGRRPARLAAARQEATLASLGISKAKSSHWQRLASVPAELFEQWIAELKQAGKKLSTAELLRRAERLRGPAARRSGRRGTKVQKRGGQKGSTAGDLSPPLPIKGADLTTFKKHCERALDLVKRLFDHEDLALAEADKRYATQLLREMLKALEEAEARKRS